MERLLNTIAWPAIALLLLCFVSTAGARIIYVNDDANGLNDRANARCPAFARNFKVLN